MSSSVRTLNDGWSFSQVGGGEGTKDGEWLGVSEFPTTVHVELLKLKRIPDPVSEPDALKLASMALHEMLRR